MLISFREKRRVPAWCDRILWKGGNLRQRDYGLADLKISDHRPVWGSFDCKIRTVDEARKRQLERDLYRNAAPGLLKNPDRSTRKESQGSVVSDHPPASERRKWWLNGGRFKLIQCRVSIADSDQPDEPVLKPPAEGLFVNPHRKSNPFPVDRKVDWVQVDRRQNSNPSGAVLSSRPRPQGTGASNASSIRSRTPDPVSCPLRPTINTGTPPPIPPKPAALSLVDNTVTMPGRDSPSHNHSSAAFARGHKESLSGKPQSHDLPDLPPDMRRNRDGPAGSIPSSRVMSRFESQDGPSDSVGPLRESRRTGNNAPDLLDSAVDDKVSWRPLLG